MTDAIGEAFAALGLPAGTATPAALRLAYREAAKAAHPDNPATGSRAAFDSLNQHRDVLEKHLADLPCEACAGAGRTLAGRGWGSFWTECEACGGTGRKYPPKGAGP